MSTANNIKHFDIGRAPVHINYRLHGSICKRELDRIERKWQAAKDQLRLRVIDTSLALQQRAYIQQVRNLSQYRARLIENSLHDNSNGPYHLKHPTIKSIVMDSWMFLHENKEIELHALCIMPNHVHVVLAAPTSPQPITIADLMKRHKGYTGRMCNRILGVKDQPFWASNYFDRTVRYEGWMDTIWYILNNPVKAKLIVNWMDWPGTWLSPRYAQHFVGG